ncbi:toll/interleukin-1 receptor domain-containing protein [Amycolatopsis thermoflava]|uniref:toll/interleukin-1 receptor domain-containing protein n=1 Tax=Amycolatopsis thermoflava TaxID=84480 RepID=UPI000416ADC0|nr:toll/interleukin-1 receptor domain-containing protein [Amycolatopsis thermoflava]
MSFAGAQRALARQFARECESLGLVVFFDENVTEEMWGRDFITEFRRVYGGELARYVVPFLSVDYFNSGYPMDEFYSATAYAIQRGDDPYVLPITVGDVEIPEKLLRSSIGYLRSEDYSVEQLAHIAAKRVKGSGDGAAAPAPTPIPALPLPKVPPADFSALGTLESGLITLGERFHQAKSSLARFGYTCHVRTGDSSLEVRVESRGRRVYGLKVQLEDRLGGDRLTMSRGWPDRPGSGINAWAAVEWDATTGEGRFRFSDFGRTTPNRLLSADELFDLLWQNVIEIIEQTHGSRA